MNDLNLSDASGDATSATSVALVNIPQSASIAGQPAPPRKPVKLLALPEAYYDPSSKDYYRKNNRGGYIRISKEAVMLFLISLGLSNRKPKKRMLSPAGEVLLEIQTCNNLDYVGPLAGYKSGFYAAGNLHMLVTESPNLVIPHPGTWPLIEIVGTNLFGPVQWPYVLSWLKVSLEMVLTGTWQAGQAFVMCGPKQSGKNLFAQIILSLLGGRSADPFQYMTGDTTFNSDMFGAEVLLIEDKAESVNIQARRSFGASIKAITVNEDHRHHRKYGNPQMLRPLWRIVISLNDDPERVKVLPTIDSDIDDKIMLFKVSKHAMPMPTHTGALKKQFEEAWRAEMPAFADYLQKWQIPPSMQYDRFGVEAYLHPDILSALEQTTPEQTLREIIDRVLFPPLFKNPQWTGRALDLEHKLKNDEEYGRDAERLLPYPNTCGGYLARLEKHYPDRFARRMLNGGSLWTIGCEGRDVRAVVKMDAAAQLVMERLAANRKQPGPLAPSTSSEANSP